jgi:putative acetyltransferase
VIVRRYQSADQPGLLLFLASAFTEMGNEFRPDGKDSDIRDIDRVYINNNGSFYVIENHGKICGCIGVRKFSEEIAEVKRLYLAQECRGIGLGLRLCVNAIEDARGFGYKFLRLDTTAKSRTALALFAKLGFHEIARYNPDPFAEIFMEKIL